MEDIQQVGWQVVPLLLLWPEDPVLGLLWLPLPVPLAVLPAQSRLLLSGDP